MSYTVFFSLLLYFCVLLALRVGVVVLLNECELMKRRRPKLLWVYVCSCVSLLIIIYIQYNAARTRSMSLRAASRRGRENCTWRVCVLCCSVVYTAYACVGIAHSYARALSHDSYYIVCYCMCVCLCVHVCVCMAVMCYVCVRFGGITCSAKHVDDDDDDRHHHHSRCCVVLCVCRGRRVCVLV